VARVALFRVTRFSSANSILDPHRLLPAFEDSALREGLENDLRYYGLC
jgi:hypothetical protein